MARHGWYDDGQRPLAILFVCTANICRSPTAEYLARSRFGEQFALFRSAGLMQSGREMPADLLKVLAKRDLDASAHRSHHIEEETLAAADLVLTMEGRHVQELAVDHGFALPKILPLKEAANRLHAPRSIDDLLADLERRDLSSYLSTRWDVDDPYKRGKRRYRKMVEEVDELLGVVIGNLAGAGAPPLDRVADA